MRTLLDIFMIWPMPAFWLALIGVILIRCRFGKALLVGAVAFMIAGSLPITAKLLLQPLANAAPHYAASDASANDADITAIVVFLAGAFADPEGRWWPMEGSVQRSIAGLQLQRSTDLPIILTGGAPLAGQPPEAEIVAQAGRQKAIIWGSYRFW